jgi:tyrosyl-tRNA synthetase
MGKSLRNYIAITAPASDMYGKLMSLPDHAMMSYFETLTDVPQTELDMFQRGIAEGSLNPRDVKMRMAREIVSEFHNPTEAQEAEEAFVRQFSQRELPLNIRDFQLKEPMDIVTFMVDAKLAKSKGEARRLIQRGGVSLIHDWRASEGQRINDIDFIVPAEDGAIVRVGKLKFIRIRQ